MRRELGLADDVPIVLMVARFHPVKDFPTALRAWAEVCRRDERTMLVIAGDGTERAACEALAGQLEIAGRVRFLGVRRDVPDLLAAADLMLLTSLSEAHSVSLLEAMASRLPIVATDTGGVPETVEHGRTGLLTVGDAGTIATALLELLTDPSRRQAMGQSAAELVQRKFLRSEMHRRYLELYHGVAREEGRR